MIVALAFNPKDVELAYSLLELIQQIGGVEQYDCLLVADAAVDWGRSVELLSLANRAFRSTTFETTPAPVEGWPAGANQLWLVAARHAKAHNVPFLWLEPDCVPLKRGWLIAIDKMKGKDFFGHVYQPAQPGFPPQMLSGIAVYPPEAFDIVEPKLALYPDRAWDVAAAEVMMVRAQSTKLIQHIWGTPEMVPTFVTEKTAGVRANTFTLADLFQEAVLFHRCKDGTLAELVRKKLGLGAPGNFVVVWPFCNFDAPLLIKNLEWMYQMGMSRTHECLLSYDRTTLRQSVNVAAEWAKRLFLRVHTTAYSVPPGTRFPQTVAWQHAARVCYQMNRNWLWMEPDAIPLKAHWLTQLQTVYDHSHVPFCGPVVEFAGHMNGTAIYPADTPERLPRTMSHSNNAWDVEAKDEMAGKMKDIGHIFYCAWGVKDGRLNPVEGEVPSFPPGSPLLNQIPKTAVVFHRCKDGSLIDRLNV